MKTQCPNCKELWDIEEREQGALMKCFNCTAEFTAAVYTGPIPEEPPLPKRSRPLPPMSSESQQSDYVSKKYPGGLCQVIAVLTAIAGGFSVLVFLIMNHLGAALVTFISAFLSFYAWNSLGKTMNGLQQVQEQVEELQRELKQQKDINS